VRRIPVLCLLVLLGCSDPETDQDPQPDSGQDVPADADAADAGDLSDVSDGDGGDVSDAPDAPDAMDAAPDIEADVPPIAVGAWRDWSAQAAGPLRTGAQIHQHTYTLPTGVERTIEVTIWYPTRETSGEPTKYLGGLVPDAEVFLNAPPADPVHEGGFPLTIHSHGDRAYGGEISDRARYTTSHGWVVVAVDHTGNLLPNPGPTPPAHRYHRPLDISAALDLVASLPVDNPLSGRVVTDRATLTGHSRGAYTVWALAGAVYDEDVTRQRCGDECTEEEIALFLAGFRDERLVAVSPQAGVLGGLYWGADAASAIDVPVFFMSGSEDDVGGDAQWERVGELDFTWVEFEGGCHLSFTLGILCDTLGRDEGWHLTNTYSLAFARKTLLGDISEEVLGLLDGSVPVEKATIRVKE
jgi:predicted dienelactone hydrolase